MSCSSCGSADCSGPSQCVKDKLAKGIGTISPEPGGSQAGTLEPCPADPLTDNDNQGQQPITEGRYQCSLGVSLAPIIDTARRVAHDLGVRPYRVFLVWEERDTQQVYNEIRRVELMPVTVSTLTDVDLELTSVGLNDTGALRLSRVSTVQVTEQDLRGHFDGVPLDEAASPDDRQFYYEIVKFKRCSGGTIEPQRRRYVLGSEPYHNGSKFQWEATVVAQNIARSETGEDKTLEPDLFIPDISGKVTRIRR